MNLRTAIFISIEGLGTNLIGAYGNSIAPTPCIDSLAAQSLVLDQLWNDSTKPEEVLKSWWTGKHQLEPPTNSPNYSPWLENVAQALLVTDSEQLAQSDAAEHVGQVVLIQRNDERSVLAPQDRHGSSEERNAEDSPPDLDFEHLLQVALGTWHSRKDEFPILWIHSQGLNGAWDAPYELREMLCDEGDPPPVRSRVPLELKLTPTTDPDEVFQIACAVGGQAMAFDQAIGDCFDALGEIDDADRCLFAILGTNGFPLGEHGQVGGQESQLHSESLHVPCIMRLGSLLPLSVRLPILLQPHQVGSLLNLWFSPAVDANELFEQQIDALNLEVDGESPLGTVIAKDERAVYVGAPAWSYIAQNTRETAPQASPTSSYALPTGSPQSQLFAKPDDRWEQNDISSRASNVLDKMEILNRKLTAHYESAPDQRTPLNWHDDELTQLHR